MQHPSQLRYIQRIIIHCSEQIQQNKRIKTIKKRLKQRKKEEIKKARKKEKERNEMKQEIKHCQTVLA